METRSPIKANELACLASATSVCCAESSGKYTEKLSEYLHPSKFAKEANGVLDCHYKVRDELLAGPCAPLYKDLMACTNKQVQGYRDMPKACKYERAAVTMCAVKHSFGELKEM